MKGLTVQGAMSRLLAGRLSIVVDRGTIRVEYTPEEVTR